MSITLTNPLQIANPATKVRVQSLSITTSSIVIQYTYIDAGSAVVKTAQLMLTGQDYADAMAYVLPAGVVGKQIGDVLLKLVKTKLKNSLGLAGTVEDTGF